MSNVITLSNVNHRISKIESLNPKIVGAVKRLNEKLVAGYKAGLTHSRFEIFETLRSAERQNYLFMKGSTKAREWQSAHNYGLAVDFVAVKGISQSGSPLWSWDINEDWQFLAKCADEVGLSAPISWDKPHIQSHIWDQIKRYVI